MTELRFLRRLWPLILTAVALLSLLPAARAQGTAGRMPTGEYIIISGGVTLMKWEKWKTQPHDLWWMNFIRAARIRIQELQAQGVPGSQITWFVYEPSYHSRSKQEGRNLIPYILSVRDAYGVNLRFFQQTSQLINYLNAGRPRDRVKIVNLEYFGHSNRACLMFDYSNVIDSSSKAWWHENDFNQLRRGIFAPNAFVKSWGCHTGESMSQKFREATGIRMWGAVGRSQYRTHELPTLASPTGRWTY